MSSKYKHPMPYYVLIGGTHDGEPWDGEPQGELRLLKRSPATASSGLDMEALKTVEAPMSDVETYHIRMVHTAQGEVKCYGLATMNDLELQIHLLRGYHPNRKSAA